MKKILQYSLVALMMVLVSCREDPTFCVYEFVNSKTTATDMTKYTSYSRTLYKVTLSCTLIEKETGDFGKADYYTYFRWTDGSEVRTGYAQGQGNGTYTLTIDGLTPGTKYSFAPYIGENFEHPVLLGETKTFTTPAN